MLQNICRICATDTDAVAAIKLFEPSAHKLLRQIKLLTGVLLEVQSGLPEIICKNCQNDLDCAMEFRRRCLRNHKRWQLKQNDSDTQLPPPNAHALCVRRSTRQQNRELERKVDREQERKPGLEVEMEQTEEEEETQVELLIKVEHTNNDNAEDDNVDHLKIEREADFSSSEDNLYTMPKPKRHRRLTKPTVLKKPSRPKPKLPVYFCDQCGKNITGKSPFERHLRKHNGIRPFQCEICPARFLSAGELKGHQVMHTGDRNFPCRYCDRAYVNYSGRLRHERTHTNDRPFVCAQCGKAFTNSYILKNHMLVHTGERMFRCDLCERSFLRSTHLHTHYRSNTHKQNVAKSNVPRSDELSPASGNITTQFISRLELKPSIADVIE